MQIQIVPSPGFFRADSQVMSRESRTRYDRSSRCSGTISRPICSGCRTRPEAPQSRILSASGSLKGRTAAFGDLLQISSRRFKAASDTFPSSGLAGGACRRYSYFIYFHVKKVYFIIFGFFFF